jgi:hypothetical protein
MVEGLGLSRLGGAAGQFWGGVVAAQFVRPNSTSENVKISAIAN